MANTHTRTTAQATAMTLYGTSVLGTGASYVSTCRVSSECPFYTSSSRALLFAANNSIYISEITLTDQQNYRCRKKYVISSKKERTLLTGEGKSVGKTRFSNEDGKRKVNVKSHAEVSEEKVVPSRHVRVREIATLLGHIQERHV